jgi:hypothetical protein
MKLDNKIITKDFTKKLGFSLKIIYLSAYNYIFFIKN